MKIETTNFAREHAFNPDASGTTVPMCPELFARFIEQRIKYGVLLEDGYAPFVKHVWIEIIKGFEVQMGVEEVTDENRHLLVSGYKARRDGELPVLTRWFEGIHAPSAKWLDVVLYSGDQIRREDTDNAPEVSEDADWGIVTVLAAMSRNDEIPLAPMTQLRNALGTAEGGSGHPIDREAYMAAVKYWETHAVIDLATCPKREKS